MYSLFSYFGWAEESGVAVVSFLLFLAAFLAWECFLVLVVSDFAVPVLLDGAGVWDATWAKLRALPSASVQAMANNFFMHSPLKGSKELLLIQTRVP
jgi:hypothetical protein